MLAWGGGWKGVVPLPISLKPVGSAQLVQTINNFSQEAFMNSTIPRDRRLGPAEMCFYPKFSCSLVIKILMSQTENTVREN